MMSFTLLTFLGAMASFAFALVKSPGKTLRCTGVVAGLLVGVPATLVSAVILYALASHGWTYMPDANVPLCKAILWAAGIADFMVVGSVAIGR